MKIMEVIQKSLLAEASYADFSDLDITDFEKVKSALTDSDFSKTQAEEFVKQWRVVDYKPNTETGKPETLFATA